MHALAVISLLASSMVEAAAQTPPAEATLEAARALLTATHFAERNLPAPNAEAVIQSEDVDCMAQSIDKKPKQIDCAVERRRTEAFARRLVETYPGRKARLIEVAAQIYARHFSREDMVAATRFYSSDAGQHLFAETDAVAKEFQIAQQAEKVRLLTEALSEAVPPPK